MRAAAFAEKLGRLTAARVMMTELNLTPSEAVAKGLPARLDGIRRTAIALLSLPDVNFSKLITIWPQLAEFAPDVVEQLEIDAHYAGYLDRQDADILAFRRDESRALPADIDYAAVNGLSNEARLKLERIRPATLGQAGRIDGVTPAALTLILAYVKGRERKCA
jgi:tRNA uridine 5-carboxymethylaminomethyl modification enzyme